MGFPGMLVVKNPPANSGDTRDVGSIPGLQKILWSRKWQPNPVVLPRKSHGQRSLGKFMGSQIVEHDWSDLAHTHMPRMKIIQVLVSTTEKYTWDQSITLFVSYGTYFLHFFPFFCFSSLRNLKKKMIYANPSWRSEVFTKFILLIKLRFLADQGQMTGLSQVFPLILSFGVFFFYFKD